MMKPIQTKQQVLATLSYKGSVSQLPLSQKLLSVEVLPEPKMVRRIEMSFVIFLLKPSVTVIFSTIKVWA
ncbi:hypothetical protein [Aphanothece hegewaldii]|nr:hypothetical protein [Aphanothece hegewaldii]